MPQRTDHEIIRFDVKVADALVNDCLQGDGLGRRCSYQVGSSDALLTISKPY